MKVILVERIKGLGDVGQVIQVRDGYARNFLLAQKKAMTATPANVESVEARKTDLEAKEQERLSLAQARADKVKGLALELACRASDEGKLYGAVPGTKVVELLAEKGVEVKLQEVIMPKEQVRHVGDYQVVLSLHPDITCEVPLQVAAEGS